MADVKLSVEVIEPSTAVYSVVRGWFVHPQAERRDTVATGLHQLLISYGDFLQLWSNVDGSLEIQQTFYLFEHVEHMDLVPSSLGLFGPHSTDAVLFFTFDGRCAIFKLELHVYRDQLPAGTAAPSTAGPYVLTEVACLNLPIPKLRDGLLPKRLGGVCSSGVAPVSKLTTLSTTARGVLVAAINMGMLHIFTFHTSTVYSSSAEYASAGGSKADASAASSGSGTTPEPLMMCAVVLIQDTPLYGTPPGASDLEVMSHMSHVYDMCFLPPSERDALEPPLLAVLHKLERSGGPSFTLDCLALELTFGGDNRGARGGGGGGGASRVAGDGGQAPPGTGGSSGPDAGSSSSGSKGATRVIGLSGSKGKPGGASEPSTAGSSTSTATAGASGAVAGEGMWAAESSSMVGGDDDVVPLRAELRTGPWVVRFLHPTTTVITSCPPLPAAGLPGGVLAVSSLGATLYCKVPALGPIALMAATAKMAERNFEEAHPAPAVGDLSGVDPADPAAVTSLFNRWFGKDFVQDAAIEFAEANVRQVELVRYALGGMPLYSEMVSPGVFLIGDSGTGLTLLHAAGLQPWAARVEPNLPGTPPMAAPVMPKLLSFIPPAPASSCGVASGHVAMGMVEGQSDTDGLLFVGSDCSNSQVLSVPAAHITATALPPSAPSIVQQRAAGPDLPPNGGEEAGRRGYGRAEAKHQPQREGEEENGLVLPPALPVLRWPVVELAAVKSLAPVTDVVVVPDSSGADDPWLIASCGRNGSGRLVRARLAAGLHPYMSDGPRVPDGGRMFPLRLATTADTSTGPGGHTHIAFSFEAADRTDLLCVAAPGPASGAGTGAATGGEFTQVELPGLNHGSASLLIADVAGQRLVQVTQAGVRILQPLLAGSGLAASWMSPEPLSLAAHSGLILAVASRTRLHLLRIDLRTGAISMLSEIKQLPAQLSALALYRPSLQRPSSRSSSAAADEEPPPAEVDSTFVLMGQWLSNRVEVAAVAVPTKALLHVQLAEDETPRSLALLELPGGGGGSGGGGAAGAASKPPVLLAGTHTGRLLMWQLVESPMTGRPWRLGPCYSLRVGRVSVELQPVPYCGLDRLRNSGDGNGAGYVYIHSHSGALVRPRLLTGPSVAATAAAAVAPLPLDQLVEVIRVHGSEGLQALCHVSTAAMPDSSCWVTREGQLLFGRIDPRVKLRWSTAFVGETIHSFAYHSASNCLVALCEAFPIPTQSLRVIELNSLLQVMAMRFSYGHNHTAIAVGHLPCASGHKEAARRAAAARRGGGAAPTRSSSPAVTEKEFVVLGSYLSLDSSCDSDVSKHVSGVELQYGALSFMELVAAPAVDGSNSRDYKMLLQGICFVPSVPTSIAIARPSHHCPRASGVAYHTGRVPANIKTIANAGDSPVAVEGGGGGGGDTVDIPYLLVGSQGRVHLFQAHIDDLSREGERAVKRAIDLAGQVDQLNLPVPKHLSEVDVALQEIEKEIQKRAAADVRKAALKVADGAGAHTLSTDGTSAAAVGRGGGATTQDEGLAEDESDLPEVEVHWEERLKRLQQQEEEEDLKWKHGMGLMEPPDSDDEEVLKQWAQERGLEEVPLDAARAVKMLRRMLQREEEAEEAAAAAAKESSNGEVGAHWDSDESSDVDFGNRGSGCGRHHRVRPSLHQLLRDLQREWSQHVVLRPIDVAETFAAACVTSITCLGPSGGPAARSGGDGCSGGVTQVLASDFLGSVTVMRLVANQRGAALISCAPDRHPLYAQAAAWLDPEHVLVAVHPHGLAVLRRDPGAEEDAMMEAQRKSLADFEAGVNQHRQNQALEQVWDRGRGSQQLRGVKPGGRGGGVSGAGGSSASGTTGTAGAGASGYAAREGDVADRLSADLHLLKPSMETTPGLGLEVACRVRQIVTRMCRARLGLRLQPHHHPAPHQPAEAAIKAMTSQPARATSVGREQALTGSGPLPPSPLPQQGPSRALQQNWDANDLLLCFSTSGYVASVRLQQHGTTTAGAPAAAAAATAPSLAKLVRLQHAVTALDPADAALITGVDSDSYCHGFSWPLVVPRETAAGAGLAGGSASTAADEWGRRRLASRPPPPGRAEAGPDDDGAGLRAMLHLDREIALEEGDFMGLEAEAEALAAGCVDGAVLRVLLGVAEAQLRRDAEAQAAGAAAGALGGGGGGGGRVAALLRRLAREVTGAADLGSLVGLLQRSSVVGIGW